MDSLSDDEDYMADSSGGDLTREDLGRMGVSNYLDVVCRYGWNRWWFSFKTWHDH